MVQLSRATIREKAEAYQQIVVANFFEKNLNDGLRKEELRKMMMNLHDKVLSGRFQVDDDWVDTVLVPSIHHCRDCYCDVQASYKNHRIAGITNNSVSLVGVATCWCPLGWVLMGVGGVAEVVNNIVEIADKTKSQAVSDAETSLKNHLDHPFGGLSVATLRDTIVFITRNVGEDDTPLVFDVLVVSMIMVQEDLGLESSGEVVDATLDALQVVLFRHENVFMEILRADRSMDARLAQVAVAELSMRNLGTNISKAVLISMYGATRCVFALSKMMVANLTKAFMGAPSTAVFNSVGTWVRISSGASKAASGWAKTLGNIGVGLTAVFSIVGIIEDSIKLSNADDLFRPTFDAIQKIKDETVPQIRLMHGELVAIQRQTAAYRDTVRAARLRAGN